MLRNSNFFEVGQFSKGSQNNFRFGDHYYLTNVCDYLDIYSEQEVNAALGRVYAACQSLNISFEENFHSVYLHNHKGIYKEWMATKLGLYLFLINSNTSNPKVAKVQIYFFNN